MRLEKVQEALKTKKIHYDIQRKMDAEASTLCFAV